MKKLLGTALVFVLSLVCAFALAACKKTKPSDEELAKDAISLIKAMYSDGETSSDYNVVGQVKLESGDSYAVTWTIESQYENYSNYLTVGEMNTDTKLVKIGVTKAADVIDYKLKASVTVGEVTESTSFNKTVPAKLYEGEGETVNSALNFSTTENNTSQSATQQIWEQSGIKLTNDKAGSSTDVALYAGAIRLYSGSTVKIEFSGMVILVFNAPYTDYVPALETSLKNALGDAAEITTSEDGLAVTVELANPLEEIEFTCSAQIRLTSLEIEALADGSSDQQKVDGAKAMLTLTEKSFTKTGEYELPAIKNGATISWSVKDGSDYVSINNGKLSVDTMPAETTDVTITATFSSGSASANSDFTLTLIPLAIENDGTLEHPYTPTEAKLVTATLEAGAIGTTLVYVQGYVIAPGTYSTQFGNFDDMYIADTYSPDKTTGDSDAFLVYRPKPDGTYLTTAGFAKGDFVVFSGYLQNYKGTTPELTSATCVSVTSVSADMTDAEKVEWVKENLVLAKTEYTSVGEVALPAPATGDVTVSWTVKETTDLVAIENGKLVIKSLPETETTVTLVAALSCGDEDDTKELTFTLKQLVLDLEHEGTEEDPYSVADILEIATSLSNGDYFKVDGANKKVYLTGYVISRGTDNSTRVNYVYIVDEYAEDLTTTSEGALCIYTITYNDVLTSYNDLKEGALITVCGYIQIYNNAPQITYSGLDNAYCVDITVTVDGTDDEVVAEIKDSITLGNLAFSEAYEGLLPTSKVEGVTVAWTIEANDYATIEDDKLVISSVPADEVKVTLTATVSYGTASDTKEFEITLKAIDLGTEHKGTAEDPFTVADTFAIFETLNSGEFYKVNGANKAIYVKGYVVSAGSWADKYSNFTKVYIADSADAAADEATCLVLYGLVLGDVLTKVEDLEVGCYIEVIGCLTNYGGTTNELMYSGSVKLECLALVKPVKSDAQKVAEVKAELEKLLDGKTFLEAEEINLPETDDVEVVWESNNEELVIVENGIVKILNVPVGSNEVTLTATITCGEEEETLEVTITLTSSLDLQGEGTQEKPFTVADVELISTILGDDEYYKVDGVVTRVYIKGYVTDAGSLLTYFSNVYIADSKETAKADSLWIYSANATDDVTLQNLMAGDEIVVFGYIQNYKGKNETATLEVCSYKNTETNVTTYPTMEELTYVEMTDQQKVDLAIANVTIPENLSETVDFPAIASTVAGRLKDVVLSFASDNTEVVAIDDTNKQLKVLATPNEVVSITVTATIGENDDAVTADKSVSVTVAKAIWRTATQSDIKGGAKIIISCVTSTISVTMAASAQNGTYREKADFSTFSNDVVEITLVAVEGKTNTYYLQVGEGQYLYATDANALSTGAIQEGGASEWVITINDDGTSIQSVKNNRIIRYNSSATRFAAYASGQQPITIYVGIENESVDENVDDGENA